MKWRPDRQVLATLDQHGVVRLWKDNPLLKTLTHKNAVNDAALSPDGKILASASNDGIELWQQDQNDKWPLEPTPLKDMKMNSMSWSPDGEILASTAFNTVKLWTRDGKLQTELKDHLKNNVFTVSWNPDGKTIATGAGNLRIIVWDSQNGSILHESEFSDWVQSLAWSPDGRLLAVGIHNQGGAYLLEGNPDKREFVSENHFLKDSDVSGVSWSPDGKILATSGNNVIQLWERDGKLIRTIDTGEEVGKVAWSPDDHLLAVTSVNVVKLWKQDGSLVTVLKGHTRAVKSVTWDRQTLVSASEDGTVKLWRIDKNVEDNLLDKLLVHSCSWLKDYLENNPLVSQDERSLCDGISIDRGETGTTQVASKEPVTGAAGTAQ